MDDIFWRHRHCRVYPPPKVLILILTSVELGVKTQGSVFPWFTTSSSSRTPAESDKTKDGANEHESIKGWFIRVELGLLCCDPVNQSCRYRGNRLLETETCFGCFSCSNQVILFTTQNVHMSRKGKIGGWLAENIDLHNSDNVVCLCFAHVFKYNHETTIYYILAALKKSFGLIKI